MKTKRFWLGMLVIVLTLGMTVIGCDNGSGSGSQDPALNGEWEGPVYLKLNNGNLTYEQDGTPLMKGTYTASGGAITIQVTQMHGAALNGQIPGLTLDLKWYTKAELKAAIKSSAMGAGATDAQIDEMLSEMFASGTGTYTVSGKTLTIQGDWFEEDSVTFTKVTGGGGPAGPVNPTPSGGTFSLSGIPSQYNGKYAVFFGDTEDSVFIGAANVNSDGQGGTAVLIANGSASLPMWTTSKTNTGIGSIVRYSGNNTVDGGIMIFNSAAVGQNVDPIIERLFASVNFSNGSASKTWSDGSARNVSFAGTWVSESGGRNVINSDGSWESYNSGAAQASARGTYTVSGAVISLTITHMWQLVGSGSNLHAEWVAWANLPDNIKNQIPNGNYASGTITGTQLNITGFNGNTATLTRE